MAVYFSLIKCLYLLERWFGKDWREVYLVLHEDSTLTWYSERGESNPEGGIFLKDSPEMIAAGQVCLMLILNFSVLKQNVSLD